MNLKKIITEEIDSHIDKMDLKGRNSVKKVINELFAFNQDNLLKSMGSQETILSDKESLGEDNWDWLVSIINDSYTESPNEWQEEFKKQKMAILCYKFFTKSDMVDLKEIEKNLKFDIKKYFTALQNYSDLDNFREKFFNLPSEMLKNFSRFILNNSKKLNASIKIDRKKVKERIKELSEERKKMIKKISMVSKGYQTVLDMTMMKELFDNGLFFEDNFLNRGVNEYITKMLNHKVASEKIKNTFNSVFLYNMLGQAENSSAYLKHIEAIKTEEAQQYFTSNGFQVGNRFDNEIELTENSMSQKGLVIDKDSRFKEPSGKLQQVGYPWEDASNITSEEPDSTGGATSSGGGGGGGGFSGGGGGGIPSSVSQFEGGEEQGLDSSMADEVPGQEGNEEGQEGEEGSEGEMPKDEDGFPIDFGTPEGGEEQVDQKEQAPEQNKKPK